MDISDLDKLELLLLSRKERLKLYSLFPETGRLSRFNYPRHMAFFTGGAAHHERMFMAGNRVGKTVAGAYETTVHAIGWYPDWWDGWRRDEPLEIWCAGKTTETTRDIVQKSLFGDPNKMGTGLIPGDRIIDFRFKPNTNQSLDWATIKHPKGVSRIALKSYDQGRTSFEGTERHLIWLDEEPPNDIYTECLTRTATVDGRIMVTATPLKGATEVVESFLKPEVERV